MPTFEANNATADTTICSIKKQGILVKQLKPRKTDFLLKEILQVKGWKMTINVKDGDR